jgi:hypothetical protein
MTKSKRTERKVLASLATLVEHEEKQLLKIRALAWGLSLTGGLVIGFVLGPAIQANGNGGWFLGIGLLSGALIGFSIYFFSTLAQWPVVRRYLDVKAIIKAHQEGQP